MNAVCAGQPLIDLIRLAYRSDQPVLTHGRHGVGKSELFARAAKALGVGLVVRDLSLLEPPDLVGVPKVGKDGRTRYAPPAFLPTAGNGILLLEEVNRAPRYMRAPCLQLLTARRLNDYELPAGWLPCAAVNDAADGYEADDLDAALLSRFLRVRVLPDVKEWTNWAQSEGAVHPKVVAFVSNCPGVFDDPAANPRSWTRAARVLNQWEVADGGEGVLADALAGLVGESWAVAFLRFLHSGRACLTAGEILDGYRVHRAAVRKWAKDKEMDLLRGSLDALQRHVQPQQVHRKLTDEQRQNAGTFLADLPADLRRLHGDWLADRGLEPWAAVARAGRRVP